MELANEAKVLEPPENLVVRVYKESLGHFATVTGLCALQCQKHLRLQEVR
jgi:hypothetical protein